VQREFLKEQSNLEAEAALKHELQKRIDEQDAAAEALVRECSSLEQASNGCDLLEEGFEVWGQLCLKCVSGL